MKKEIFTYGIIILIVVALILLSSHWVKKLAARYREKQTNKDLNGRINKKNLSYGESQYTVFAKALFSAMDGIGTDTDSIMDVFKKMKNIDDILMLQVAFSEVEDENDSLTEWLHDDLSSGEIKQLNNILAERGIIYSF